MLARRRSKTLLLTIVIGVVGAFGMLVEQAGAGSVEVRLKLPVRARLDLTVDGGRLVVAMF